MGIQKSNKYFHIAFCVNDNYIQYICVTIKSILDNNPDLPIWIHILTDGILPDSEKRLNSVWQESNKFSKISIHIVEDTDLEGLKIGYWSKYAWYRIFIPQVLGDVDRILYLDADTLVVGNLSPLQEYDLTGKSIGAVTEDLFLGHLPSLNIDSNRPYYCDGVLLMNLDYWREYRLKDKIIDFSKRHHDILTFPDQDSINVVCFNSSFHLPIKYGITPTHIICKILHLSYKKEIKEALISPIIIHYLGWHEQPWFATSSHYAKNLWINYNKSLRYRAKIKYEGSRLRRIKVFIWNLLYDYSKKQKNIVQQIINE